MDQLDSNVQSPTALPPLAVHVIVVFVGFVFVGPSQAEETLGGGAAHRDCILQASAM
jgi:hypothetical protein